MIEKNMKSRHVQKHATESEWRRATLFIPKQAEIIVYDVDETYPYERFKIGDGVTLLKDLPFSNENTGSTGESSFDIIITSKEQFLSSNLTNKKVLIKDTTLLLAEIDCKGAKYVEFCNVYASADTGFEVTIKNFERGNFMGLYAYSINIDDTQYYCDNLHIEDFGTVENCNPSGEDRQHHTSGLQLYYLNGLGIMNSYVSNVTNCCNIINCHVQGRNTITFNNCSTISNIHDIETSKGWVNVTFENCSHLSNIELNDNREITYINCSKVDPSTCDGYEGGGIDLTGYATEQYVDDAIANVSVPGGHGFVRRTGADSFNIIEGELLPTDTRYADYEGKIMKYIDGSWQAILDESVKKAYVDEKLGDIDSVLDAILAKQNAVLGGNS